MGRLLGSKSSKRVQGGEPTFCLIFLERETGLEPATSSLGNHRPFDSMGLVVFVEFSGIH